MKLRRRRTATAVAMSAALAGTFSAAVLLAAACTSSSAPSSQERASALCAKAAGTGHVVASFATTVGEVRAWKEGPNQRPAAAAWSGYPAGDFAAWCWLATSASGNSGNVVAISGGKPAITFATGDFAAMPPSADGPAVP